MKLHRSLRTDNRRRNVQAGISLIETMIALGLLLIAAAGIMTMATLAMSTTETQGHLAARTAEYAQDKMEQLLALRYLDTATDVTQFPAVATTPPGPCPPACGLQPGGGVDPSNPLPGYSDYVDRSGNPAAVGANWQYVRVWQITADPTNTLKTITVVTQVRFAVGQNGVLPRTHITSLKSSPF